MTKWALSLGYKGSFNICISEAIDISLAVLILAYG